SLSPCWGSSSRPRFSRFFAGLGGTNSSTPLRLLDVLASQVSAVQQMLLHLLSAPFLDLLPHGLAQPRAVGALETTCAHRHSSSGRRANGEQRKAASLQLSSSLHCLLHGDF